MKFLLFTWSTLLLHIVYIWPMIRMDCAEQYEVESPYKKQCICPPGYLRSTDHPIFRDCYEVKEFGIKEGMESALLHSFKRGTWNETSSWLLKFWAKSTEDLQIVYIHRFNKLKIWREMGSTQLKFEIFYMDPSDRPWNGPRYIDDGSDANLHNRTYTAAEGSFGPLGQWFHITLFHDGAPSLGEEPKITIWRDFTKVGQFIIDHELRSQVLPFFNSNMTFCTNCGSMFNFGIMKKQLFDETWLLNEMHYYLDTYFNRDIIFGLQLFTEPKLGFIHLIVDHKYDSKFFKPAEVFWEYKPIDPTSHPILCDYFYYRYDEEKNECAPLRPKSLKLDKRGSFIRIDKESQKGLMWDAMDIAECWKVGAWMKADIDPSFDVKEKHSFFKWDDIIEIEFAHLQENASTPSVGVFYIKYKGQEQMLIHNMALQNIWAHFYLLYQSVTDTLLFKWEKYIYVFTYTPDFLPEVLATKHDINFGYWEGYDPAHSFRGYIKNIEIHSGFYACDPMALGAEMMFGHSFNSPSLILYFDVSRISDDYELEYFGSDYNRLKLDSSMLTLVDDEPEKLCLNGAFWNEEDSYCQNVKYTLGCYIWDPFQVDEFGVEKCLRYAPDVHISLHPHYGNMCHYGYFRLIANGSECYDCDSTCARCDGPYADNCTVCEDRYNYYPPAEGTSSCPCGYGEERNIYTYMCLPRCGNGLVSKYEYCDDGNNVSGDGCRYSCSIEPGYICSEGDFSVCTCQPTLVSAAYTANWTQIDLTFNENTNIFIEAPISCSSIFSEEYLELLGENPLCSIEEEHIIINIGMNPRIHPLTSYLITRSNAIKFGRTPCIANEFTYTPTPDPTVNMPIVLLSTISPVRENWHIYISTVELGSGHDLHGRVSVEWRLNGMELLGYRDQTLHFSPYELAVGEHEIELKVENELGEYNTANMNISVGESDDVPQLLVLNSEANNQLMNPTTSSLFICVSNNTEETTLQEFQWKSGDINLCDLRVCPTGVTSPYLRINYSPLYMNPSKIYNIHTQGVLEESLTTSLPYIMRYREPPFGILNVIGEHVSGTLHQLQALGWDSTSQYLPIRYIFYISHRHLTVYIQSTAHSVYIQLPYVAGGLSLGVLGIDTQLTRGEVLKHLALAPPLCGDQCIQNVTGQVENIQHTHSGTFTLFLLTVHALTIMEQGTEVDAQTLFPTLYSLIYQKCMDIISPTLSEYSILNILSTLDLILPHVNEDTETEIDISLLSEKLVSILKALTPSPNSIFTSEGKYTELNIGESSGVPPIRKILEIALNITSKFLIGDKLKIERELEIYNCISRLSVSHLLPNELGVVINNEESWGHSQMRIISNRITKDMMGVNITGYIERELVDSLPWTYQFILGESLRASNITILKSGWVEIVDLDIESMESLESTTDWRKIEHSKGNEIPIDVHLILPGVDINKHIDDHKEIEYFPFSLSMTSPYDPETPLSPESKVIFHLPLSLNNIVNPASFLYCTMYVNGKWVRNVEGCVVKGVREYEGIDVEWTVGGGLFGTILSTGDIHLGGYIADVEVESPIPHTNIHISHLALAFNLSAYFARVRALDVGVGDVGTNTNTNTPHPICGNGIVEKGEECDDGNESEGDGCSECHIEAGYHCSHNITTSTTSTTSICTCAPHVIEAEYTENWTLLHILFDAHISLRTDNADNICQHLFPQDLIHKLATSQCDLAGSTLSVYIGHSTLLRPTIDLILFNSGVLLYSGGVSCAHAIQGVMPTADHMGITPLFHIGYVYRYHGHKVIAIQARVIDIYSGHDFYDYLHYTWTYKYSGNGDARRVLGDTNNTVGDKHSDIFTIPTVHPGRYKITCRITNFLNNSESEYVDVELSDLEGRKEESSGSRIILNFLMIWILISIPINLIAFVGGYMKDEREKKERAIKYSQREYALTHILGEGEYKGEEEEMKYKYMKLEERLGIGKLHGRGDIDHINHIDQHIDIDKDICRAINRGNYSSRNTLNELVTGETPRIYNQSTPENVREEYSERNGEKKGALNERIHRIYNHHASLSSARMLTTSGLPILPSVSEEDDINDINDIRDIQPAHNISEYTISPDAPTPQLLLPDPIAHKEYPSKISTKEKAIPISTLSLSTHSGHPIYICPSVSALFSLLFTAAYPLIAPFRWYNPYISRFIRVLHYTMRLLLYLILASYFILTHTFHIVTTSILSLFFASIIFLIFKLALNNQFKIKEERLKREEVSNYLREELHEVGVNLKDISFREYFKILGLIRKQKSDIKHKYREENIKENKVKRKNILMLVKNLIIVIMVICGLYIWGVVLSGEVVVHMSAQENEELTIAGILGIIYVLFIEPFALFQGIYFLLYFTPKSSQTHSFFYSILSCLIYYNAIQLY